MLEVFVYIYDLVNCEMLVKLYGVVDLLLLWVERVKF